MEKSRDSGEWRRVRTPTDPLGDRGEMKHAGTGACKVEVMGLLRLPVCWHTPLVPFQT